MKKLSSSAFLVCFIATASVNAADKFRVASGGFTIAIHALLWVAYEKKLFNTYGLDAEYLALQNGTIGMQTLLANEVQALFSACVLGVSANLQGANVAIIAGGLNILPYKLVVRPEIGRTNDLKGKRIAITQFGSASEYGARLALEKIGLSQTDMIPIQVGGTFTSFSALNSGSVQAAVLNEPIATMAIRQHGMKVLVDLAETGMPYAQNCFMVKRSYLDTHRTNIINFMKAVIEGYFTLKQDKPFAVQLIKKYIRVDDEQANIGYDYYVAKYGNGVLNLPDRKGLEFVMSEVAKINPKAKGQTPESLHLLDPSIIDEIKTSGFLERVK